MIDKQWPHQVAVHIDLVRSFHFRPKMEFSHRLSASPRGRCLMVCWPGSRCEEYHLYCFGRREDAQAFIDRFGGEHFDPAKDRGNGKRRDYWMRDTMGDRSQRYPEILGRLEQALGEEPSLEIDMSWLLDIRTVYAQQERCRGTPSCQAAVRRMEHRDGASYRREATRSPCHRLVPLMALTNARDQERGDCAVACLP